MEHKYESDLTKKEKRQLEWERVRDMSLGNRVEYFITYYKHVIFIALAALFLIYMAVSMIMASKKESIFSLAIIDVNYDVAANATRLQEELLDSIGTGAKNEVVTVDINGSSAEDVYMAPIKLTTIMMGANTDAVVCNQAVYEKYKVEGAFLDWETVLGEDYSKYEEYMEDGAVNLSKCEKWTKGKWTSYTPAYACVLSNGANPQAAKEFLEYLFEE